MKTLGRFTDRKLGTALATAAPDMTNIPTELLRTLITVVDLRSFTKAAHSLGMTQPAVSAQIKRLQVLLGGELLDKSAPGVTLTLKGESVVQHARQLLSVNDEIVGMARPRSPAGLRIGISDEAQSVMLGPVCSARAAGARRDRSRFGVPTICCATSGRANWTWRLRWVRPP
jgi:DNA-binding transcriptional LysR family regulator